MTATPDPTAEAGLGAPTSADGPSPAGQIRHRLADGDAAEDTTTGRRG